MKNTKTAFKFFTITEWKEEEKYLQQQHTKGWEFIKVNFLGLYHFKKCKPEDVVYQLDYNPDKNKSEYINMFNDCGWEYLQDYVGYSYFRKPASKMDGNEEIFCDDSSRVDMMKRVFKGRMIPLLVIFFLIIIPNIFLQTQAGTTMVNHILAGMFIALLLLYISLFINFGYKFWKYLKSVHK